jgi:hypothetical protein
VAASEGLVAGIAGAILDGESIDWASAESTPDATERALLSQLRVLAAVADVCRGFPAVPVLEDDDRRSSTAIDQAVTRAAPRSSTKPSCLHACAISTS